MKPFIVANVRDITDQYDKEEISYSRMVEMLNEIAEKHIIQAQLEIIQGYYNKIFCDKWDVEKILDTLEADRIFLQQE